MPTRDLRVLVVDDDAVVLRLHRRGLARTVRVECASNGCDALELVRHLPFDAVVTDFEMAPGEDGLWLLERVRLINPMTRRVLTSARPIEVFAASLRNGLVQAFVAKPATIEELLASISVARRLSRRAASSASKHGIPAVANLFASTAVTCNNVLSASSSACRVTGRQR